MGAYLLEFYSQIAIIWVNAASSELVSDILNFLNIIVSFVMYQFSSIFFYKRVINFTNLIEFHGSVNKSEIMPVFKVL